jgi:hypothetical protein
MEENAAQEYVDKQMTFNKDIIKTIESLDKGIRLQAKVNTVLAEQIQDQDNRLKTHRQLLIGVTFGTMTTALAVILVALT